MEEYRFYSSNIIIGKLLHNLSGEIKITFYEDLDVYSIPINFYFQYADENQRVFEGDIVSCWITNRALEKCKYRAHECLEYLELESFDPWIIFLAFAGRSSYDLFWVEKETNVFKQNENNNEGSESE